MKNYNWKLKLLIIFMIAFTSINLFIYVKYNSVEGESKETLAKVEKNYGFVDTLELIFAYEDLEIKQIDPIENGTKYEVEFLGTYKDFIPIAKYLINSEEVLEVNDITILDNEKITFTLNTIKNK
ncbi:hypothetical protein [Clostridium senegalense]|uniref:hypothetical protein n=1 Tax=Clostridium senegalense TaxID=1465809 RepID=UPI001C10CBEA|nr:hypothetical protein [Clostridium senegalense]MBU5225316.1 hypothetical protein [Clostridium senegalense]